MDKIYLPLISKHRKIIFENDNYNDKVVSKGKEYELDWENPQKLKKSFDAVIRGLLLAKKQYEIAKKKKEEKEEKEREIKERAAADAERRRAARKRAEIDRNQQESDGLDSFRRNHNVKVCTHSPFFHFSCSTIFFCGNK